MRDSQDLEGSIEVLQRLVGYRFSDTQLLIEALTHSSFANEYSLGYCNERLEFLGDSVIGLCVAEELFVKYPSEREGRLTKMRARVVCCEALADAARAAGFAAYLRLGKALKNRATDSILADAFEALIGAVYLDGGIERAREVVLRFIPLDVDVDVSDPKSALQEMLQHQGLGAPKYKLEGTYGPPHDATFWVSVWCADDLLGRGRGKTRKEAEASAASEALSKLAKK
ncbi:MAG: ribonuclease III [Thermanaerothrix sp.]|nr:ribonuclease III [Thermanaerothrix sp.]